MGIRTVGRVGDFETVGELREALADIASDMRVTDGFDGPVTVLQYLDDEAGELYLVFR